MRWRRIPEVVVGHVWRCLQLVAEVEPGHGASRTAKPHRRQIRVRWGVKYDMVRAIAVAAIRESALTKNHPPGLVNVALEKPLEVSLELPGFSTVEEMGTRIRAEVDVEIFALIVDRMRPKGPEGRRDRRGEGTGGAKGPEGRQRMHGLLSTKRAAARPPCRSSGSDASRICGPGRGVVVVGDHLQEHRPWPDISPAASAQTVPAE